jgi:tetratricopeptide (TPR) repeat protein
MKWDIVPSNDELTLLMEAGLVYRDYGKLQEARDVFSGVRAMMPQSEVPDVFLGTVSMQEGDYAAAQKHYQRALETNPKSAFAYTQLGELNLVQKNEAEARANLKKAIELDPRGDYGKTARGLLELADIARFD